jgi:hypothetical protein
MQDRILFIGGSHDGLRMAVAKLEQPFKPKLIMAKKRNWQIELSIHGDSPTIMHPLKDNYEEYYLDALINPEGLLIRFYVFEKLKQWEAVEMLFSNYKKARYDR